MVSMSSAGPTSAWSSRRFAPLLTLAVRLSTIISGSSWNRVGENVGMRGGKPAVGAAGSAVEAAQKSGHDTRMPLPRRRRRLGDAHRVPGFRPISTAPVIFGDPYARVLSLACRSKQ